MQTRQRSDKAFYDSLNRLEDAWRACFEYDVHTRYQQPNKAQEAKDRTSGDLSNLDWSGATAGAARKNRTH